MRSDGDPVCCLSFGGGAVTSSHIVMPMLTHSTQSPDEMRGHSSIEHDGPLKLQSMPTKASAVHLPCAHQEAVSPVARLSSRVNHPPQRPAAGVSDARAVLRVAGHVAKARVPPVVVPPTTGPQPHRRSCRDGTARGWLRARRLGDGLFNPRNVARWLARAPSTPPAAVRPPDVAGRAPAFSVLYAHPCRCRVGM